jgi:ubiquinone/menaquinone biosynthesis C-methylase UbiE
MRCTERRQAFIDRTARKPSGERGIRAYNDPKGHYKSFRIIMDRLNLSSDDRYAEIGCGGGVLLKMVLGRVQYAAAIDHSPDMVELAKSNNRIAVEEGRAEIIQGDAASLPWSADSFTACASANMFFFVEEPQRMLSEVCRVLKTGGRFVMITAGRSILMKLTFGWLYKLRTYTDRDMRFMLEQAGFSRIEVKSHLGYYQICCAVK